MVICSIQCPLLTFMNHQFYHFLFILYQLNLTTTTLQQTNSLLLIFISILFQTLRAFYTYAYSDFFIRDIYSIRRKKKFTDLIHCLNRK